MAIVLWVAMLTIVRVTDSETVADVEKLNADLTNLEGQTVGMQGDTTDLRKSVDAFRTNLGKFLNKEDADVFNRRLGIAKAVVDGTLNALPKFKSGETGQILSGVLDMTSMALETFGGPYGAAAAVVINIVSSLIGLFMTTPKATPSMEQVMKDVLDEFQDEKLYRRMNSFVATLGKVHYGIVASRNESRDTEGNDLSDDDITQLKTEIELFSTGTLLEDVKQGIADEIESEKVSDAQRAIKTLNIYCKLTIVVELVLVEFMEYIKEEGSGSSPLPAYYSAFLYKKRDQDKKYLEFLHLPNLKEALVAAMYQTNPEKYPELRQYIKTIRVTPIPKSGFNKEKPILLTPKAWPGYHFYESGKASGVISASTHRTSEKYWFYLKSVTGKEESGLWKIQNMYYPTDIITARRYGACSSPTTSNPDVIYDVVGMKEGDIEKLHKYCEDKRKNSDVCPSNCYKDRQVSLNYIWKFTTLKISGKCSYYFISATQKKFGPGYTLFMDGYAYLKYGNPKEKGMFKRESVSCD